MKTINIKAKSQTTMRKHILNWYNQATTDEVQDGLSWYEDAQQFARLMAYKYNYSVNQISQIISILSPQTDWNANKLNTELFLVHGKNIKIYATNMQKEKCEKVLNNTYSIPLTAQKTYAFADNIANTQSVKVTIDRHASKVANNVLQGGSVSIAKTQYLEFEKAYNFVANKLNITAYQLQAITWVTYKRVVNR